MTDQTPPPPPPPGQGVPAPAGQGASAPQPPQPPAPAGPTVPGQQVPGQQVPGQQVPGQGGYPPPPGTPPYPPGPQPGVPAAKKSNGCLKAFLITLAVVVVLGVIGGVLLAVLGVGFFNAVTAPIDTTNEYLQALQDERYDDAWASTCTEFQEANPQEDFRAQIAGTLEEREGIEKINASGAEVESTNGREVATVTYTLTFGNGQTIDNEAELVKEDGEWKFCGADS